MLDETEAKKLVEQEHAAAVVLADARAEKARHALAIAEFEAMERLRILAAAAGAKAPSEASIERDIKAMPEYAKLAHTEVDLSAAVAKAAAEHTRLSRLCDLQLAFLKQA